MVLSIGKYTNLHISKNVRLLLLGAGGHPWLLMFYALRESTRPFHPLGASANELGQHYEIVSIQPAEPPSGGIGSNWHRYVIAFEGNDTITGCRAGSLNVVTSGVEEMVALLNERHKHKRGRVNLVSTPKKNTHI